MDYSNGQPGLVEDLEAAWIEDCAGTHDEESGHDEEQECQREVELDLCPLSGVLPSRQSRINPFISWFP